MYRTIKIIFISRINFYDISIESIENIFESVLLLLFIQITREKMAESESCEIPSELIRTALRETVEKKLNSKNCKIDISSASEAGSSNFIGIVYRAKFRREEENESESNPIQKMIVKVVTASCQNRSSETHFALKIQGRAHEYGSPRTFRFARGIFT